MPKTTPDAEAFQALLEGSLEKAPRRVIDLAKIAAALEPAARPGPDPRFKARLRSQLLASASATPEEAFAAMLEGDKTIVLDELAPLAQFAHAMAASATPATPSPSFRFQLRNRLVAEATHRAPARGRAVGRVAIINERLRRSFRAVGATGLAAMMMLGSSAALAASHNALPGDTLYGVKRFRESAQLSVTRGVTKGTRLLGFAHTRLNEVRGLTLRHVTAQEPYVSTLNDMDAETLEGTSILIDEFRAHGTRVALETVVSFSHSQAASLALLIDLVPPGARPTALDSLSVAESAGNRASSVLQGCPCPSNALEQPNVADQATQTTGGAQPVQCGCATTSGGGNQDGGSNSGSEPPTQVNPRPTHDPQSSPDPAPSPGLLDPIPDVPGTNLDDQVKETIAPYLPTPTPSVPVSSPSVPAVPSVVPTTGPLPTAVPSLLPSVLPSLPSLL